jgi:hypothetical protein
MFPNKRQRDYGRHARWNPAGLKRFPHSGEEREAQQREGNETQNGGDRIDRRDGDGAGRLWRRWR